MFSLARNRLYSQLNCWNSRISCISVRQLISVGEHTRQFCEYHQPLTTASFYKTTFAFSQFHSKQHQFRAFSKIPNGTPNNRHQAPPIIIGQTDRSGPSLKTSLLLLSTTVFGVLLYCSYKVGYRGDTVFIPLWISRKKRAPYKSEVDSDKFIDSILCKLHNRLSVDEEVNRLLGVAIEFPRDDKDEDKFEVYIRSSSPGITGLMIEPSPSWQISFTSRPFSSPSSGIDRLLQPFLPGEADSEDANSFPGGDGPSFYEAVLDGKIKVRSCRGVNSKGYHHSIDEGTLRFRATRSLSHANASPRFSNTILTYTDSKGNEVVKRLW